VNNDIKNHSKLFEIPRSLYSMPFLILITPIKRAHKVRPSRRREVFVLVNFHLVFVAATSFSSTFVIFSSSIAVFLSQL
jgi:hypothetical protein